jgi:uncharacterized tellurite resistance protein B-like protein
MKLSLFSIIGGTFNKLSGVPITDETLRRFEETVSNKVAEKLSTLAPLLPELIKITPELVVSEEHNGDVMVKDIILETKEMAAASTASVVMMAGDDTNEPEQARIKRVRKHREICKALNDTYAKKNADYGNAFGDTFQELGIVSAVTRIIDKTNRLKSLCRPGADQKVNDESIRDTLLDLANYAIMTVMEMDAQGGDGSNG